MGTTVKFVYKIRPELFTLIMMYTDAGSVCIQVHTSLTIVNVLQSVCMQHMTFTVNNVYCNVLQSECIGLLQLTVFYSQYVSDSHSKFVNSQ